MSKNKKVGVGATNSVSGKVSTGHVNKTVIDLSGIERKVSSDLEVSVTRYCIPYMLNHTFLT